jgi:hypothetical protein
VRVSGLCLLLLLSLAVLGQDAATSAGATEKAPAKFGAAAIWPLSKAEKAFVDMQQCGAMMAGGSPGAFETCVAEAMRKHGASADAIAFTTATGGNAIATAFRDFGPVDVMEAVNPFQANSNDQLFFVNGSPAAVSADAEAMKLDGHDDARFQAVLKNYPNAFIFPHAEMKSLQVAPGDPGGQKFLLQFPIVDGCHACARIGQATYEFDFAADGKFLGASIANLVSRD